jgi:1-acyl-sn-glycerol-3-phosphate acyltransferase
MQSKRSISYYIARIFIDLLFFLIARIRVEGWEHVPQAGGFIAVSNHIGRLDAPLVFHLMRSRDVTIIAAEKYKKYAFFRWFARHLNAIWVDRFNADFAALRQALARLKNGAVVVLAPEGTRSKSGAMAEARAGASYLAVKSGVPVLPVGLMGTHDSEVVEHIKRFKRIDILVRVGPVFSLPPLSKGDRESALQAHTDEMMARVAVLLPETQRGAYAAHPRVRELLENS